MKVLPKALLLAGVATLSLSACSGDKGPGEIGSKDDIVVVNKGMPGAQAAVKAEGEDFTSTVEQAEAIPTPEVAPAEHLAPETADAQAPVAQEVAQAVPSDAQLATSEPAVQEPAVQEVAEPAPATTAAPDSAPAPVPTPAAAPVPAATSAAPATESAASPAVAPTSAPVATPAPTPTAAVPAAAPVAAAAKVEPVKPADVKNIPYPLDPNAPYSPKAMAAAAAAAGTPVTPPEISPSGINLNDPAIIRSVQAKLAEKKLFVGPQTGMMSADLMNGIAQYQVQNNLAIGPLNEETLKHLGVIKE